MPGSPLQESEALGMQTEQPLALDTHELRKVSHWFTDIAREPGADELRARPVLTAEIDADVCIVGGGYTGLWTAYSIKRAEPSLHVVVVEAKMVGYGASGRNGGAVIAQLNGSRDYWNRRGGPGAAVALERALQATVDEVGAVIAGEGIDCGYAKGGVVIAARNDFEAGRLKGSVEEDHLVGFGADDCAYLDAAATRERIAIDGVVGARFSPHSASIQPAKLVRGLAAAVERLGVVIYERSPVVTIEPRRATTERGAVSATSILRATEGYTDSIRTERRNLMPIHTSMLATAPLTDDIWQQLGWERRETLLAMHPFLHLQHTYDRRITIGGADNRLPYRFRSRPAADGAAHPRVAAFYRAELVRLFPVLRDVVIEQSWHGVFGVPRTWAPTVSYDRATGLGSAGGYVGEGVAPSNLAGRTLRDLVLGHDTELTRLPWVGNPPRRWEPEPLRAIGGVGLWSMRYVGDQLERRRERPSRLVRWATGIAGFTGHLG